MVTLIQSLFQHKSDYINDLCCTMIDQKRNKRVPLSTATLFHHETEGISCVNKQINVKRSI